MTGKVALQALGKHSSSRMRTGDQGVLGLFEGRNGLLTADRREVVEGFAERIAGLQVVEEGLEGDRRPTKTGVPPMIEGSACTTGGM